MAWLQIIEFIKFTQEGGSIAQWLAYLLSDPATLGLIPCVPENVSKEKIINIAQVNQRLWFEESGQWLENVD